MDSPNTAMRDIRVIHLEPTDVCQARCPQCARETDVAFDHTQHNHLSIAQLQELLDPGMLRSLDKMFMCGNYGDPAAGRHTLDIYRWFREHNGAVTLGMNTNGAIRSRDWWQELARIMDQPLDYVVFSIDGLEDTNHVYRRGVQWDILMQNSQAFIQAGGRAHWDMLVFEHNEHQVQAAQDRARDLGFSWFRAKVSKRPSVDTIKMPRSWQAPSPHITSIACHALTDRSMYIDARGRMWPCCWLAADRSVNSVDFEAIQQSWHGSDPHTVCATNCGQRAGHTRFQQQWRVEAQLT
jgi:sulfatase maturation enzyme AslB (radical SAM superfamily)